ncbi:replicative DNA helicase [Alkalihalobacillus sp. CinArs1]|uniref:replicative DNA helicase n=1 Tax=Alkalihalobacillus sp. CinArs1 TaxID=2995314 RepID=UPI0022DD186C|nr:replicative DNA helicase [Alkalihalobacillus sp. CinArs1]
MQNLKAEQSILSCIIRNGLLLKETDVTEDHFESIENKLVFAAMIELSKRNEPIDIVTIYTQLGSNILQIGGSEYLSFLIEVQCHEENFDTYQKYVHDYFKLREIKKNLGELSSITEISDLPLVADKIQMLGNILQHRSKKSFDLIESLVQIAEEMETVREGITGITTGFEELDTITDGWQLQDLIVLAARPSIGKTAMALTLTLNAIESGSYVNFFSLEMPADSLLKRMISTIGGINSLKIKNALERFDESDWTGYTHAQTLLSKYKNALNIYDRSSPTLQEIRKEVQIRMSDNPDKNHLVIIDYLTLIKTQAVRSRTEEIGALSRGLKQMARELNCCVLVLSQLNRSVEYRQNKRPVLSDIRESGEVEQDADLILFLYREDYYEEQAESSPITEVNIAKNRNGPLGSVKLLFDKKTNSFKEARYK